MTGAPQPEPVPGADDLRWDDIAREQEFVQLSQVRAAAEKWRGGLTALTGLLAVVLTVAAPLTGKELPPGWRLAVAALQLIALGALAVGAWKAMQAAFGVPAQIRNNGVRFRAWSAQAAKDAAGQLAWARHATLVGFLALAAAAAVASAAKKEPMHTVRIETAAGDTYCGKGKTDDKGKKLTVVGEDGTERTFETASLRSLKLTTGC